MTICMSCCFIVFLSSDLKWPWEINHTTALGVKKTENHVKTLYRNYSKTFYLKGGWTKSHIINLVKGAK